MSNADAVQAIWPWRQRQAGGGKPDPARRRRHALIETAIMFAVAAVLRFGFDKVWVPRIVLALAAVVFFGGFFWPPLYEGFKRGGLWLGKAAGVTLAWVLLVPFFYVCFTLGRLGLAARRKDPMQRRFEPGKTSYWSDRRPVADLESYRRQY